MLGILHDAANIRLRTMDIEKSARPASTAKGWSVLVYTLV